MTPLPEDPQPPGLQDLPMIVPSILSCDFARLGEELAAVERAGARRFQFDVMDGHFVPNLSYGPPLIGDLRKRTTSFLEGHLMMTDPGRLLDQFLQAGCDLITIHIEAVPEPGGLLERIRAAGRQVGLAFNPPTPVERVAPWLDQLDVILAMTVMPGFGGQDIDRSVLAKVKQLRHLAPPRVLVQVDGGINADTIGAAVEAGAQLLVVGSAIFHAENYHTALADLHRRAHAAARMSSP